MVQISLEINFNIWKLEIENLREIAFFLIAYCKAIEGNPVDCLRTIPRDMKSTH